MVCIEGGMMRVASKPKVLVFLSKLMAFIQGGNDHGSRNSKVLALLLPTLSGLIPPQPALANVLWQKRLSASRIEVCLACHTSCLHYLAEPCPLYCYQHRCQYTLCSSPGCIHGQKTHMGHAQDTKALETLNGT